MVLALNKLLNSRFIITKYLGAGGAGEIYEANDTYTRKSVAIKILQEKYLANMEEIDRFENEARFSSMFSHPHIIKIFNFDYYNRLPFISFELLRGKTMKDYLDERGKIQPEEAIKLMMQIMEGVAHIHSRGILHNDLKPDNLFLFYDGAVKISDFGIATHFVYEKPNTLKCSVVYAAPEVLVSQKYSVQSDIYSLGIIFYELLTGKTPYMRKTTQQEIDAHINESIPTIRNHVEILEAEKYDYVIKKATDKNLNKRYKTVEEMLTDILKIKNHETIIRPGLFRRLFKK